MNLSIDIIQDTNIFLYTILKHEFSITIIIMIIFLENLMIIII